MLVNAMHNVLCGYFLGELAQYAELQWYTSFIL